MFPCSFIIGGILQDILHPLRVHILSPDYWPLLQIMGPLQYIPVRLHFYWGLLHLIAGAFVLPKNPSASLPYFIIDFHLGLFYF